MRRTAAQAAGEAVIDALPLLLRGRGGPGRRLLLGRGRRRPWRRLGRGRRRRGRSRLRRGRGGGSRLRCRLSGRGLRRGFLRCGALPGGAAPGRRFGQGFKPDPRRVRIGLRRPFRRIHHVDQQFLRLILLERVGHGQLTGGRGDRQGAWRLAACAGGELCFRAGGLGFELQRDRSPLELEQVARRAGAKAQSTGCDSQDSTHDSIHFDVRSPTARSLPREIRSRGRQAQHAATTSPSVNDCFHTTIARRSGPKCAKTAGKNPGEAARFGAKAPKTSVNVR